MLGFTFLPVDILLLQDCLWNRLPFLHWIFIWALLSQKRSLNYRANCSVSILNLKVSLSAVHKQYSAFQDGNIENICLSPQKKHFTINITMIKYDNKSYIQHIQELSLHCVWDCKWWALPCKICSNHYVVFLEKKVILSIPHFSLN